MKILFQIASPDFSDWQEVDSTDWAGLGDVAINALCIQGDVWQGSDFYGIRVLGNGIIEVAGIHDSHDWPPGSRWARVTKYTPLGPDPRPEYGGAINSVKTTSLYAEDFSAFSCHENDPAYTFLGWNRFNEKRYVCKRGIWLSDDNFSLLVDNRGMHSWREWGQHLPPEELDSKGLVLDQATLGRKVKPKGTQTFVVRTGTGSSSAHTAEVVHTIQKSYHAEDTSTVSGINGDAQLFLFTAQPGAPWVAQWPTSGVYRCQLDVSSASTDLAYGLLNFGSELGHFGRVDKEHSSCLQSIQQDQSSFSGSGLKLASITNPAWSAGSHFDQLEILIAGTRTTGHTKQSITLRLNRPDDYIDGPWEPVPAITQAMLAF